MRLIGTPQETLGYAICELAEHVRCNWRFIERGMYFENEERSQAVLKILENCPKTTFQIVQSEDGLYRIYEVH